MNERTPLATKKRGTAHQHPSTTKEKKKKDKVLEKKERKSYSTNAASRDKKTRF